MIQWYILYNILQKKHRIINYNQNNNGYPDDEYSNEEKIIDLSNSAQLSNSQKHKNFILKSDYLQNSYNNNSSVHKSNATNNSCSNLEQKSVGEIHNESPHFQNNSGNCNFNINICNNNITNIINKTENNIAMTPNETKTNKQQIISKNSNTTTTSFKATISNIDKNVHSQFIKSRFGEFNTNIPPQQINLIGNNKQPNETRPTGWTVYEFNNMQ